MNQIKIPIRQDLRPEYYDSFQCIGGGCRHTCCAGWSITFDRKDYLRLRHISGSEELNERLKGTLQRTRGTVPSPNQYAEFRLNDRICPLLNGEHLCSLQLECGHDVLPEVCKTFPRQQRDRYSGYREHSLTLACEGVLELLWNQSEGIFFLSDLLQTPLAVTVDNLESKLFLSQLVPNFQDIRALCIDCLQTRALSVNQRILLVGMQLKKLLDAPENVESWLTNFESLLGQSEYLSNQLTLPRGDKEISMYLFQHIRTLGKISVTDRSLLPLYIQILNIFCKEAEQGGKTTVSFEYADCHEAQTRFQQLYQDKEYFFENLAVHLFFSLGLPDVETAENFWKEYVNFCSLYSLFRFIALMSCWKDMPGDKDTLFDGLILVSRSFLHNRGNQTKIRDEFFSNDSTTLAHMAILLSL